MLTSEWNVLTDETGVEVMKRSGGEGEGKFSHKKVELLDPCESGCAWIGLGGEKDARQGYW